MSHWSYRSLPIHWNRSLVGPGPFPRWWLCRKACLKGIWSDISIWHSPAEWELKGFLLEQLPEVPPPASSPLFSRPLMSVEVWDWQEDTQDVSLYYLDRLYAWLLKHSTEIVSMNSLRWRRVSLTFQHASDLWVLSDIFGNLCCPIDDSSTCIIVQQQHDNLLINTWLIDWLIDSMDD